MSEEEEADSSSQIRELIVYAGANFKFDDLRPIFRTQFHITKLVLVMVSGELDFGVLTQMNRKRTDLASAPPTEKRTDEFLINGLQT